ncbi:MAG: TlpA family protein disulfide reductase, partial [Salinibacterium sp.]|nr:TlpA family protein disulfide reductase [Salinibacterium sp.]
TGDFWSGDWWHETWTATRDPDAELPDAFGQTSLNEDVDLSDLTFTGLDGEPVRLADALDAQGGKARIVELFGTWCPNCADAAKEIRRLKELHGEALGVVALAFELSDDHERSVAQIARYKQRHKLADTTDWPILIAGVSDKAKATESVRLLDRVRSYPTTLFLYDRNEVVAIHTGFSGPATGEAFTRQQQQWDEIIERLLRE